MTPLCRTLVLLAAAIFPSAADVGVNLAELSGGSQNSWPFSDLFRHATQFSARTLTYPWDQGNRVVYSPAGYPVGVNFSVGGTAAGGAHAFVGSVTPTINYSPAQTVPGYLPGQYVLLWAGNVTIELDGDVRLSVNASSPGYNPACACGRAVVSIPTPALGIVVRIFRLLDPARPLRALHLVPLGLESSFNSTALFHPRFVSLLRAVGATAEGAGRGPLLLRFSGWAQELSGITFAPYANAFTWEDRARPGGWGMTQAGVPLEHMCALARDAGAGAAWFSVPQNAAGAAAVAAGATYLRNFTRLLVDELLAGAAADALLQGAAVLPPSWRAVAPDMSAPVPLADPAAAPWAVAGSPRNLSRVVIQYSNELNYYTDSAVAAAQLAMVEIMTGELWAVAGEAAAAAGAASSAEAVFAALRTRIRFVVSFNDPGFHAANLAGFQTALSNRFSRNSTNPLLPRRPYTLFPSPQMHPFQDFDAVSIAGRITGSSEPPNSIPWDAQSGYNSTTAPALRQAGAPDAELLARLRTATLDAEVTWAALAAEILLWARGNTSVGAMPGGRRLEFYASSAGPMIQAPVFGARNYVPGTPPALAEQAWANRLETLTRHPAMRDIVSELFFRISAAGASVVVSNEVLVPSILSPYGLGLRKTGNNGLFEGWQAGYAGLGASTAAGAAPMGLVDAALAVNASTTGYLSAAAAASIFNATAAASLASSVAASAPVAAAVAALQVGDNSGGAVSAYLSSIVAASPRLAALVLFAAGSETVPRAATVGSVMAALRARSAILAARPSPPPPLPPAAFDPVGQSACPPPPAPPCVYGSCYNGSACVCWLGASGPGCATLQPRPQACSDGSGAELGINLGGLADWGTEQPYIDLARVSRAWNPQSAGIVPQSWTWGAVPDTLDDAGYPTQLSEGVQVGTMMVRDLRGHYPPGTYYVLWEGDGCVTLSMDDVTASRRLAPGLIEVDITPTTGLNNGIYLVLSCTKPGAYVRNIRVLPRSALHTHAAFPFSPSLITRLANFSTIRFMDLTNTNGQADTTWERRVHASDRSFTINGLPWEHAVLLANTAGKHMWVNVPHLADDAYIAKLAELLRDSLRPDLRVTVEYSNEVWGALFPGGQYAQAQGVAAELDRWSPPGTRGPTQARFCFLGARTRRIAALFAAVWGPANLTAAAAAALDPAAAAALVNQTGLPRVHPRVRVTLSSQAVNADVTSRILACNRTGFFVDAVALAPYFAGPVTANNTGLDADLLSLADVVAGSFADIARWPATIARHRLATTPYGGGARPLPITAYESGQSLLGATGSVAQSELAMATNAAPEMAALYGSYWAALRSANMSGPLCVFSSVGLPSQYGSWGSLPAPDTDTQSLVIDPATPGGWPAVKWWALRADAAGSALSATMDAAAQRVVVTSSPAAGAGTSGVCAWNASAAAEPTTAAFGAAARACPAAASLSYADARAGVVPAPGAPLLPCAGHGECSAWPAPTCTCFEGWTGPDCATPRIVVISTCPYQCNGRGTCALQRTVGYRDYWACNCNAGYAGDACAIFTCAANCNWNGRCVASNTCACYDGYGGRDCGIDCGCGQHGLCAMASGANASVIGRYASPTAALAAATALGISNVTSGGAAIGPSISVAAPPPTCACDAGYAFAPDGGALLLFVGNQTAGAPRAVAALRSTGQCAPVCACADPSQTCLRPGVCSCSPRCVYGDCVNGACSCWVGYGGSTCENPLRPDVAAQLTAGGGGSLVASRYSPVGMNVAGLAYWSTDVPFSDIMKSSSSWLSQYKEAWRPSGVYIWDRSVLSPQNLSANGYPAALLPDQALGTLMARDVKQRLPNGRYVVTYEGDGELVFGMDATVVSRRKGRIIINVVLSLVRDNGIYMRIEDTNPANPIRNIRVLLPGTESLVDDGVPFHPRFLDNLRNYSALRFMDWSDLHSPTVTWGGRARVSDARWTERGVPIEEMVHLCNILGTAPWFSISDAADEAYVAAMAALVRDTLRPDVPIFIERSNEVWSAATPTGKRNYAEAARLGIFGPQLHAARSVQMFQLWAAAFGPQARRRRLQHVLSTQTVNPWITRTMLSYNRTWESVDALGVTAYVDCGGLGSSANAQRTALLTVDRVLDLCDAAVASIAYSWQAQVAAIKAVLPPALANASAPAVAPLAPSLCNATSAAAAAGNASVCGVNGTGLGLADLDLPLPPWLAGGTPLDTAPPSLPLIVYEGGPGLVEQAVIEGGPPVIPTAGLTDLLIAANRAPRMAATYRRYLDSFVSAGIVRTRLGSERSDWLPFMHFSSVGLPTKYGSWGLLESAFQDWAAPSGGSPKARALQGFIADVVATRTRVGCRNPGALNFDPAAVYSAGCVFPPTPVSEAGGTVAFTGLGVQLAVPAGAVAPAAANGTGGGGPPRSVAITVKEVSASSLLQTATDASGNATAASSNASRLIATTVYSFGPAGTTFSAPVVVCVDVNLTEVAAHGWGLSGESDAGGNASLALYWAPSSGNASDGGVTNWTLAAPSTFNEVTGELCGTLWHFTYAAGLRVPQAALTTDVVAALAQSASASISFSSSNSAAATASQTRSGSASATGSASQTVTAGLTPTATPSQAGSPVSPSQAGSPSSSVSKSLGASASVSASSTPTPPSRSASSLPIAGDGAGGGSAAAASSGPGIAVIAGSAAGGGAALILVAVLVVILVQRSKARNAAAAGAGPGGRKTVAQVYPAPAVGGATYAAGRRASGDVDPVAAPP